MKPSESISEVLNRPQSMRRKLRLTDKSGQSVEIIFEFFASLLLRAEKTRMLLIVLLLDCDHKVQNVVDRLVSVHAYK